MIIKKCLQCGNILPKDSDIRRQYCNKGCYEKVRWLRRRDSVSANLKLKRLSMRKERYCECGNLISKKEHHNKKYCSEKCRSKHSGYNGNGSSKLIISYAFLYQKYVVEQLSSVDISKILSCSNGTICNRLKYYGITARITNKYRHTPRTIAKLKEVSRRQKGRKHPRLGHKNSDEQKRKSRMTRLLRNTMPIGSKNPMWGKHHTEKTRRKISTILKLHKVSVMERNPNWLGGLTFLPYPKEFNRYFKMAIAERDDNVCFECGMNQKQSKQEFGQRLHVHHIDYDKDNTTEFNCCLLCCRCNITANYNRDYWTKKIRTKMEKIYDYFYSDLHIGIIGVSINTPINKPLIKKTW